jgi:predicted ATP-dependent protease
MSKVKQVKQNRQRPGMSIEAVENQITRLAYDLARERIEKKTATGQEIIHFLRTGSVIAQLEKAKLERENQLLEAKTDALKSQKKVEELYEKAMSAFRTYNGQEEPNDRD